jgi:hypothetical protein
MIIGINGKIGSGKDTVGKIIQYLTANEEVKQVTTLEEWLDSDDLNGRDFNWKIKKFAGKLKQIASLLTGIDVEKFEDQEFKKQEMTEEWWYKNVYDAGWDKKWTKETINYPTNTSTESHIVKTTYRQFLQNLGTEAMRDGLHTNVWVNALFADYKAKWVPTGDAIEEDEVSLEKEYPNWIITDMRFPNELEAIFKRGGITIKVVRPGVLVGTHASEIALDDAEFDYEIENNGTIEDLIEKVKEILSKENII